MKQVKLTAKHLTPAEDKLPSKDERKKNKERFEAYQLEQKKAKEIMEEFFNEKVISSDISVSVVEDLPELLKGLISIYIGSSKIKEEMHAKNRELQETKINELDVLFE